MIFFLLNKLTSIFSGLWSSVYAESEAKAHTGKELFLKITWHG